MTDAPEAFTVLLIVSSALGIRATYRLTRRYHDVSVLLDSRERLILASFVVVAWVITFVALVLGILSARRLFGFEAFPWGSLLTLLLSLLVLLIPAGLDVVVARVARVPWR